MRVITVGLQVFVAMCLLIQVGEVSAQSKAWQKFLEDSTRRIKSGFNSPKTESIYPPVRTEPELDEETKRAIQESIRELANSVNQEHQPQVNYRPTSTIQNPGSPINGVEASELAPANGLHHPVVPVEPNLNIGSPDEPILAGAQDSVVGGCDGCQYDISGMPYGACGHCNQGQHPCNLCYEEPFRPYFSDCCGVWSAGGWIQAGYHDGVGLFNDRPDNLLLQQGWLFAEKKARRCCGFDWGFRIDTVYGSDGIFLQSFGNNPGRFDFLNGFDFGPDSWAIPQLYGEVAYSNWSVKFGHFLSNFNYESAMAPENFFYSRSFSFALSTPRTFTGTLINYDAGATTWNVGWTAGWNTGFDRFNDGSTFTGGFRHQLGAGSSIAYNLSVGDTGVLGDGNVHTLIYERCLGCRWKYAFEASFTELSDTANESTGFAQYLIYRWSQKADIGQRIEWWKSDFNGNGSRSAYSYTAGLNYRVNSNIVVRPELRYNWGEQFVGAAVENPIFGIDAIIRF